MAEFTKAQKQLQDRIRDILYYNGAGAMSVTYADALMEIPLIASSPRMAKLLERLVRDGWNASISEEAKKILALVEGKETAQ